MLNIKDIKTITIDIKLREISPIGLYWLPIEYMNLTSIKLNYLNTEYELQVINHNNIDHYTGEYNDKYVIIYAPTTIDATAVGLDINGLFPQYTAPASLSITSIIELDSTSPVIANLELLYQDPFIQNTSVYGYNIDLSKCVGLISSSYEHISIDRLQLLQDNKLRILNFKTTANTQLWVIFNNFIWLDHKYNHYSYYTIKLSNDSDTASVRNITVFSENISLYFGHVSPHRFKGTVIDGYFYLSGYNFSYCSNLFIGFFNNMFIGTCYGYQDKIYLGSNFDSNKIGNIDLIPLGYIEFSVDGIEWKTILGIDSIGIKQSINIYSRVVKQTLTQLTAYSSIRAIGLEDL